MRKLLGSIILGVSLLTTSCEPRHDEHVNYSAWRNYNNTHSTNKLEVTRQNGDKFIYLDDAFNDLKIDKFITIKNGVTNVYRRESTDCNFFGRKQREFDEYMSKRNFR